MKITMLNSLTLQPAPFKNNDAQISSITPWWEPMESSKPFYRLARCQSYRTGEREGREAAYFQSRRLCIDVAYTSVLTRAIRTLWLALTEMDQVWIPVHREWRLNESTMGSGVWTRRKPLKSMEMIRSWYGEEVTYPATSYDREDEGYAGKDRRYSNLSKKTSRWLNASRIRSNFFPWEGTIAPQIKSVKQVLIAVHGNSLRALIKYLDGVSEEEILVNVPTVMPLVYDLDESLKPNNRQYPVILKKSPKPWKQLRTKEKQNRGILAKFAHQKNSDYFIQMDTSSDKPKKLKREYDENFAVTQYRKSLPDIQNSGSGGWKVPCSDSPSRISGFASYAICRSARRVLEYWDQNYWNR